MPKKYQQVGQIVNKNCLPIVLKVFAVEVENVEHRKREIQAMLAEIIHLGEKRIQKRSKPMEGGKNVA